MNPTDQARKEARRRELKKNKKQRQMVRCQFYPMTYVQSMSKIRWGQMVGLIPLLSGWIRVPGWRYL